MRKSLITLHTLEISREKNRGTQIKKKRKKNILKMADSFRGLLPSSEQRIRKGKTRKARARNGEEYL